MHASLFHLHNARLNELSPNDMDLLLANAVTLRLAAGSPHARGLLRGKSLALVSERNDDSTRLFQTAASELGARVSQVWPQLSQLRHSARFGDTVRLLSRLYDGLECQGLAPDLVAEVGLAVPIPVYDGVACPHHPTASLASRLGGADSDEMNRRLILQTVLVSTLN
jgi:ornithine carbamoyltransferase